ncbi:MAG: hypothetical protein WBD00_04305 [Candidatus Omnitrophota bacterium]
MGLSVYRKTIRIISILLIITIAQFNISTSHAFQNEAKAIRYTESNNNIFMNHLLATPSIFGPLYSIQKEADGRLSVLEPPAAYQDDLYTEVVLAFLGHSVDNGVGEGPFEEFMQNALGGIDFEKCRIGHVKRIGDTFCALYTGRDPDNPRVHFLQFSELEKGAKIDKARGAVIKLLDGTEILVEIDYLSTGQMPKRYTLQDKEALIMEHEVTQVVLSGRKPNRATDMIFTGAGFQDLHINVFANICNHLLAAYMENKGDRNSVKRFLSDIRAESAELSENSDISRAVQLMAGQALTIIFWAERKINGAEKIRLTTGPEEMVANDKRGRSFIDRTTLPQGVPEVKAEGAPGFYWRGTEGIAKLGSNVADSLMFDKGHFDAVKDNVVMYLMDHGFYQVPDDILDATKDGTVSTVHETYFVNDLLPGSFQTTSTGAGHFQASKVDIKCVTAGRGIQVNVRYSANGEIEEIIAQQIKEGDWTLALPGCVDYMINLGGLRFNDVSIDLSAELASQFNPDFDFSDENLKAVDEAVKAKGKTAPYLAAKMGGKSYLLKNMESAPDAKWLSPLQGYSGGISLMDIYVMFSPDALDVSIPSLASSQKEAVSNLVDPDIEMLTEEVLSNTKGYPAPSLGRAGKIIEFIDSNTDFVAGMLGPEAKQDVLVRIPVEAIEAVGPAKIKDYLAAIQGTDHGYIELFSATGVGQVSDAKYTEYGIDKKTLPDDFTKNRENTITLFTILKSEELTAKGKQDGEWGIGGISPTDTIISPIGLNYDRSGFIRGIILGLRLSEIARQKSEQGEVDVAYAEKTLSEYRDFCWSQGVRDFNLKTDDLVNLATGNINKMVEALNRIIKVLPIMPINTEELRVIYEHAREALIRA